MTMTEDKRRGDPPDGRPPINQIEISFAVPVFLSVEQNRRLHHLLDEIVRAPHNQPDGCVHWVSSYGSKPTWSQADARFLGKPVDPNVPETGEPEFNDEIYSIETCFRPFASERERNRVLCEEEKQDDDESK